jgi:gliding motility-associated-like protein
MSIVGADCSRLGSIAGLAVNQTPAATPFVYAWRTSTGTSEGSSINLGNVPAGNYELTVKDSTGCTVSKTYSIPDLAIIPPSPVYPAQRLKRGSSVMISPTSSLSGASYRLYSSALATLPNSQSATGSFLVDPVMKDTVLYVDVLQNGCSSKKTPVTITVFDEVMVHVPSAFSPNNDGINDVLVVRYDGLQSIDWFAVFDRYGRKVFETKKSSQWWNGMAEGKPVPVGTFYYILHATDMEGKKLQKSGSVTLLR